MTYLLCVARSRYTHFALWSITSSPLILSLDLNNQTAMDSALANHQQQRRHWCESSHVRRERKRLCAGEYYRQPREMDKGRACLAVLSKAQGQDRVAVLLVNHGNTSRDLSVEFASVPKLACAAPAHAATSASAGCAVRDIWAQKDLGTFKGGRFTASKLPPHASAFLVVGPPK